MDRNYTISTTDMDIMTEELKNWNNELKNSLLPDTIILGVYLLIGIIGNAFVIFIYFFRFQSQKEERFFIPYLAVIDMIACIICTTFSIAFNMFPVLFTSDSLCKVFWTLSMFSTGCSIFTLLIIAIHRYRKICKPFGWQITQKWKKISLAMVICTSFLLSIPNSMFSGIAPIHNDVRNVTGSRCSSIVGQFSIISALIFKGVILLSCMSVLVTLCVLYTLIGRTIHKQLKFNKSKSTLQTELSVSETSGAFKSSSSNLDSSDQISKSNTGSHGNQKSAKLTIMFMIISAVFFVAFVPKVAMLVLESRNENFWVNLSATEMSGYRFLYTLYIINNIVNPFIYGFFDVKFRQEFNKLICRRY